MNTLGDLSLVQFTSEDGLSWYQGSSGDGGKTWLPDAKSGFITISNMDW